VGEAEKLFHTFWTMQALPAGRGLWTGGVPGIANEAAMNCWYATINGIDDWCWVANVLMLGGGVGVGLENIGQLPAVAEDEDGCPKLIISCDYNHSNYRELSATYPNMRFTPDYVVRDSREGWVNALYYVLMNAWTAEEPDCAVDVSLVRSRGKPLNTFGGTACGPGPLVDMLRGVWRVVRGAAGRKLTTLEALDITCLIGQCVKSGNVRRSAIMCQGNADDEGIWNAKQSHDAIHSHRHTSNNSLIIQSKDQLSKFDWHRFVESNVEYGDPGLYKLWLARREDALIEGVNPCGEIPLRHRESCNLVEVFPAVFTSRPAHSHVFELATRYALRQRLLQFDDPITEKTRRETMRIGVGLGGVCDAQPSRNDLREWQSIVRETSRTYADTLEVSRPLTTTTVKPSGSISILNGSSPGMHAAESEFYYRRMRIASDNPLAESLIAANVPHEPDMLDNRLLVFSFPIKAKQDAITVRNQTVVDQFNRQQVLQSYWADNSVSSTVRFDKDEMECVEQCLAHYMPTLKGVSLLCNSHSYEQAPYEAITEEEYTTTMASIDNDRKLGSGDLQLDDCESGACPLR
jgi:hypothetical protein